MSGNGKGRNVTKAEQVEEKLRMQAKRFVSEQFEGLTEEERVHAENQVLALIKQSISDFVNSPEGKNAKGDEVLEFHLGVEKLDTDKEANGGNGRV